MLKAEQLGLVAHVGEMEPEVALLRTSLLRDAAHRVEEARLSSILVFELHIGISVRANQSLKTVVNFIVLFGFLNFVRWLLLGIVLHLDKLL